MKRLIPPDSLLGGVMTISNQQAASYDKEKRAFRHDRLLRYFTISIFTFLMVFFQSSYVSAQCNLQKVMPSSRTTSGSGGVLSYDLVMDTYISCTPSFSNVPSWATISYDSVYGGVTVTVAENTDYVNSRSAIIYVTVDGTQKSFTVNQSKGTAPYITLSQTSLNFSSSGGGQLVTMSTNTSSQTVSGFTGCVASATLNESSLQVNCNSNNSSSATSGTVTVSGRGVNSSVSVSQAGCNQPTINSKGDTVKKIIYYPKDSNSTAFNFSTLNTKNIENAPVDVRKYVNTKLVEGQQIKYNDYGQPIEFYESETNSTDLAFAPSNPYTFTLRDSFSYDTNKNIQQTTKVNDIPTSFIWAYSNNYPVVKIVGMESVEISSSIKTNISGHVFSGSTDYTEIKSDVEYLKSQLDSLTSDLRYLVTYYTYDPLIGMTSQTDPNGKTTYYEYDSFGRLKFIKYNNGKILKKFDYHYSTSNQ